MNSILANWNGDEKPLTEVRVSVLDRAFLFGDAVYEVVRVYRGRPWKCGEHLDRLNSSLKAIKINGVDVARLARRMDSTLTNSGIQEGLIYIQVTRGEAKRTHHFPETYVPNELIWVAHFDNTYDAQRASGVSVITHPDIRWAKNYIKATSLLANCLAAQCAVEADCAEAVLIDSQDYVTEGSHTSVFAVRDGKILVPPDSPNVLPGITKRQVLALAKAGDLPIAEHRLRKDEIDSIDEMFISGTPEEILPVVRVDGNPVGQGKPGPVTTTLYAAFRATLDAWLASSVTGRG